MRNKTINLMSALVLIIVGWILTPGIASAEESWWNDGWQYRKKIIFNTTATGADIKENLSNVPVLIRLHSGNFNFTNAKEDGSDIRFVASDDTTLLKHHIEKIDTLDEIALVWVKLPKISGNTDQGFISMYYGNENAVGGQDSGGTFSLDQVAVFHLGEVEGDPQDASANKNNPATFAGGQGLPGVIGNGLTFNGAGDRIVLPETPSLDFSGGFTLSVWVRITMSQSDAWLFSRQDGAKSLVVGIDGSKVYVAVSSGEGETISTDKSTDLPVGSWHLLTITGEAGNRLAIHLDGMEMTWVNLPGTMPVPTGDLVVGDSDLPGHGFIGDLDEIAIFNKPLSGDRIRAAFATQGPDGRFYTFGTEFAGGGSGMPVFYLGAILKNITLDGLVVIVLLMILSAASWVVFVRKTGFIWKAGRDNSQFLTAFQSCEDFTGRHIEADNFEQSNLYRIYRAGCSIIHDRPETEDDNPEEKAAPLSLEKMKTFRTELEKSFINESKRLNGQLMILTLAISGGPFLGLLGTVWGVMNTFAAMAAAGEANIMAIAPGVASALSTTVMGLIVAIPALFGYNFLTARIKEITADLAIFVDEFALKVENGNGVEK